MNAGKPLPAELAARIRKAAAENPEVTQAALAERFGVSLRTIVKLVGEKPAVKPSEVR